MRTRVEVFMPFKFRPSQLTRRKLIQTGGAVSLASLLPRAVFSQGGGARKAVIHADQEIGVIRPELHSHFAEHLGSCVYGGIWVGKKSPIPNINGYRQVAVDYLKELGVPVLRWPGGCFADDYHWRDGVGAPEKRPKTVNTNWGGYTEDNSFGTNEFIGFCKLIGAEPYLAANVGAGSPEEMRDWMEYCNYPSGSTLADLRTAGGSPEPFRVRYWGIGNELWGCGGNFKAEQAAAEFRHFATFARAFGGIRPYLVGCGPNQNNVQWTRGFMDTLAGNRQPDGYSVHHYSDANLPPLAFTPEGMYAQLNTFRRVEQTIVQQRNLLDSYDPNRRIGLFLDEWGVWDHGITPEEERRNGRLWQQQTMRSAVAAGLGLNVFNRHADKLYMCNIAQMVNVLQSMLLTDGPEGKNCVRTTSYYAFMMFKPHRSKTSVQVETDASAAAAPAGGRGGKQAPEPPPDLSMSASRQGNQTIVTLVNPRHDVDMQIDFALRGANARAGRAQILHDSDINAYNSFDNPDRVTIKSHPVTVESGRIALALPAMSIVTVTVETA
jgi:alpha-N-arabinofuranosidase